MAFDSVYSLNPRKVMRDWLTGEVVICTGDTSAQHESNHHRDLDSCEDCGEAVIVCREHGRCISCCSCGNYHSMDCPWLL